MQIHKRLIAIMVTPWFLTAPLAPCLAEIPGGVPFIPPATHHQHLEHLYSSGVLSTNTSTVPMHHQHLEHLYSSGVLSTNASTGTTTGAHHHLFNIFNTTSSNSNGGSNAGSTSVYHHHFNDIASVSNATNSATSIHSGIMPSINLNLSSTVANVTAGHILQNQSVVINIAGVPTTVNANTLLTPAEKVAVYQVLGGHTQTITLDAHGSADGGVVVITPRLSQLLGSLTIPAGVTVIDLSKGGILNLTGNLVDDGNLYITASNPTLSTLTVDAGNINVQSGGLLSDILPAGGLNGISNILPSLNLDLNSQGSITNAGTITSSGSLGLTAGSGDITNSGLIASTGGNINIAASNPATNININGAGGTFEALNGNINVGAVTTETGNINMTGGNYLSENLNINDGTTGAVNASVDQVTGTLNITAGSSNFTASTGTLDIGNENITGDPSFYNTNGNVNISGNLEFSGEDLAIVAEGNIVNTKSGDIISTSSTGNGGNIVMIAGANFTSSSQSSPTNSQVSNDTSSTLTITGGTNAGGYIDLTGGNGTGSGTTQISSLSSTGYGSGGNISLIAYGGNGTNAGTVNVPSTVTINANGGVVGGNVVIIAGSQGGASTNAINVGPISTASTVWGPKYGVPDGAVSLVLAAPTFTTGTTQFTLVDNSNGSVTGSTSLPYATTATSGLPNSALQNTSMVVGAITSNSTLTLTSGTGNLGTSSSPVNTNASTIVLNSTGNVVIADTNNVSISSNASTTLGSLSLTDTASTGTGITVAAGGLTSTGAITLNADAVAVNGNISATTGTVSITATTVTNSAGITISAGVNAPTVSLTIGSSSTGDDAIINETGTGSITATTLNVNMLEVYGATTSLTGSNAVGTLNALGLNAGKFITLDNGTTPLTIGTLTANNYTGLQGLTVTSAGNIKTTADYTDSANQGNGASNYLNLNSSGTIDISNAFSFGTISLSGTSVTVNGALTATGTTNGGINITSTQNTAGTGINITSTISAPGQTVTLTAAGYDNSSQYVIKENSNGSITAGSLNVTLGNATTPETTTVNLIGTNAVSAISVSGLAANAYYNNVTLNNGTTALAIGSFPNMHNLTVTAAGNITTTADNSGDAHNGSTSFTGDVSITSSGSINYSNWLQAYGTISLTGVTVAVNGALDAPTINITSTQTGAGTGITLAYGMEANTFNFTINGYDSTSGAYAINEVNGSTFLYCPTGSVTVNSENTQSGQTVTINIPYNNDIGTINVSAKSGPIVDVLLGNNPNGSAYDPLALGNLTGVANFTVLAAGDITTTANAKFSGDLSLTANGTINISNNMTAGGTISLTSTTAAANTGITIGAGINAPTVTLNIGAGSADDAAISESGNGTITATTLNLNLLEIYGATINLAGGGNNSIGTLNVAAVNTGKYLTLNNGNTALTLGSLGNNSYTGLVGLTVTSAGNISTTTDYTSSANQADPNYNYLSLTSSGTIDLSNAYSFGTITLSGASVTIGSTLTSSYGGVSITSTQTKAGTGIAINASIVSAGQTVNLNVSGYDGSSGAYVINEGAGGSITAGTTIVTFNNALSKTSTANLSNAGNDISAFSAGGQPGTGVINNVILNDGSTMPAIGYLTNINNFNLSTTAPLVFASGLNLSVGGNFDFTTSATAVTVDSGVSLTAGGSITFNMNSGGTFTDNGSLTAGSGITVDPPSPSNLTLVGTATFDPGAGSTLSFSASNSITLDNGLNYTVTNDAAGIVFTTPVLNVAGTTLLSHLLASATINAPSITVTPPSGDNLALGFTSTLAGTLNLNGPAYLGGSGGSLTVNVAVNGSSSLSLTAGAGGITQSSDAILTAPGGLTVNLPTGGTADLSEASVLLGGNNVASLTGTGSGTIDLYNGSHNIELLSFGGGNQNVIVTTGGAITTGADIVSGKSGNGPGVGTLTLTGNTVTLSNNIIANGDVDITSTRILAGAPGISIGAVLNAGSNTVSLTADGHDSIGGADTIEETGTGSITAGTLNLTLNGLVLTTANLSNSNAVGVLNVQGSLLAFSNVTFNNGTTNLILGSFSNIYNLDVTGAGNITTNTNFNNSVFGTISLTGNTIVLSESFTSTGAVNLTGLQSGRETSINISASVNAQTVTLTADGYDGTGSNYVINEGTGGVITASTLTVNFNNVTAHTATANLANVNTVGTFNAQGQVSPAINNVIFNDGSNALNIGYLININNFNLISTGPLTFTSSFTTSGNLDFSTTATSITIDSGVIITSTAGSITFDLQDGGNFNDNGSLIAAKGINVDPPAPLTLTGVASFSPGTGNFLTFTGSSITLDDGLSYTVTNGSGVQLLTTSLLGQAGGTATFIEQSTTTPVFSLTPYSGAPTATVEIGIVGGAGTTNISFSGAPVNVSAATSVTVDSGVTVSADSNNILTVNSPTVTVNGMVQGGGTEVFTTNLTVGGTITATNNAGIGTNCCIGGLGNVLIQGLTPSNSLTINLTGTIGGGVTQDIAFNPGQYYGNATGNGTPGQTSGTLCNSGYGFGSITINGNSNLPTTATGTISASNAVYFDNVSSANNNTNPISVYVNSMSTGIFPVGGPINIYVASGNVLVPFLISNSGTSNITAAAGNITLQSYGVQTQGAINFTSSGTFTLNNDLPTSLIHTNNAPVTITASAVTINSTINAGTAIVSLIPNGNQNITVGDNGTAGGFDVSQSALGNITAGTLVVGNINDSGNLVTGGNIILGSGPGMVGPYNLVFNIGGNFDNSSNVIILGSQNLTVNAGGTADTGAVNALNGGSININSTGALTVNGDIVLGGGTLTLDGGTVAVNDPITSANGIINIISSLGAADYPTYGPGNAIVINSAITAYQQVNLTTNTADTISGTPSINETANGSITGSSTLNIVFNSSYGASASLTGNNSVLALTGNGGNSNSNITLNDPGTALTLGSITFFHNIDVTASGIITTTASTSLFSYNPVNLTLVSSDSINLSNTLINNSCCGANGFSSITLTAGNYVNIGANLVSGNASISGPVNITSTGGAGTGIEINAPLIASEQTVTLTVAGYDGSGTAYVIKENGSGSITAGTLTVNFTNTTANTATADLNKVNNVNLFNAQGEYGAGVINNVNFNNGSTALSIGYLININNFNLISTGPLTFTSSFTTSGNLDFSTTATSITIDSGVIITSTAGSLTFDLKDGGNFNDNGFLTAADGITVDPGAGLILSGTASFAPGAGNVLAFSDSTSITLADGLNYTVTNGAGVDISTPVLIGGGTSTIKSVSSAPFNLSSTGNTLTIEPSGASATINLNGAKVIGSAGTLIVDSGVTLSSNHSISLTAATGNLKIDGTLNATRVALAATSGSIDSIDGNVTSTKGNIKLTAADSVTLNGAVLDSAKNLAIITSTGSVDIKGTSSLTAADKVRIVSGKSIDLNDSSVSGSTVVMKALSNITENAAASITADELIVKLPTLGTHANLISTLNQVISLAGTGKGAIDLNDGSSDINLLTFGGLDQNLTVTTTGNIGTMASVSSTEVGTLTLTAAAITLQEGFTTGGNVLLTAIASIGNNLIEIDQALNAGSNTVTLTVHGYDGVGYDVINEGPTGAVTGSITASDLIIHFDGTTSGVTATANLTGNNAVGELNAYGVKGGTTNDIILDNGSTPLILGRLSRINYLDVTSAGAITTTHNYTFDGGVSLTGSTITLTNNITSLGTVSLDSTQTGAGTGITLDALIRAKNQLVNLIAAGYDGGVSGPYVITEGTDGRIITGTLSISLTSNVSGTISTVNLDNSKNYVAELSSATGGSKAFNNIILNDTATNLTVLSLSYINNLMVSDSPNVLLSNTQIIGNTTIYNAGNIEIGGTVDFSGGQYLIIVASGDITSLTTPAQIVTNGGNLWMNAGATYSYTVSPPDTILGVITLGSSTGGNIDFSTGIAGDTLINTSNASGSGGQVLLAAGSNTSGAGGVVDLGNYSINTAGGAGSGGGVEINASSTTGNAAGNSITLGNISSYGSAGATGGTVIISTQGNVITGNIDAYGGSYSGTGGTGFAGGNGGNVSITGNNITTGYINVNGGNGDNGVSDLNGGAGGAGGSITLTGVNSITANGSLTANGGTGGDTVNGTGGAGGAGGEITLTLSGAGAPTYSIPIPGTYVGVRSDVTFNLGAGATPPIYVNGSVTAIGGAGGNATGTGNGGNGGNGGNIWFSAGSITLTGGFNVNGGAGGDPPGGVGGNGGNGGNITLIANSYPTFSFITANGGLGGSPSGTNGANGTITIITPLGPIPIPPPIPNGLSLNQLLAYLDALSALLARAQLTEDIGTRIATDYDPWLLPQYWPKTEPLQGEVEKLANNINGTLFAGLEFSQNELNTLAGGGVEFGPNSNKDLFELMRGNVFFMPKHDIRVKTREGIAYIPKGCVAWIMETGADSAIYDCHDNIATGRIKVEVNGKKLALAPGTQVLLTKDPSSDFASLNPGYPIGYRNVASADVGKGVKVYVCSFSLPHIMANIPVIHDLLKSGKPESIKVANAMIKNAVILNDLTGSEGYQTNMFVASKQVPPPSTEQPTPGTRIQPNEQLAQPGPAPGPQATRPTPEAVLSVPGRQTATTVPAQPL